ncbi:MAG TPA: methyltransferase [Beijerinckiaceae bacterium]|jgi:tRNA1(Val) A37 N6-methylase TrmN6
MPDGTAGAESAGVTQDTLLGGRVRLLQSASGHRVGTDAVLLAAAARPEPGNRIADLGAGTGAVGLMIAVAEPSATVALVERDERLVALARRNVALNGAEARVGVIAADVLGTSAARRGAGLAPGAYDLVVTNPPFAEPGRGRASPDPGRSAAHVLPLGGTATWLRNAGALLAGKGRLLVVHRADHVGALLAAWPRGFGALRLRFVHPREEAPASRVLIEARRGSRAPLSVLSPLVLHGADGSFTPLARALHAGEARLAGD